MGLLISHWPFDSVWGQSEHSAFCVLISPHPELTSLGFLEDGSGAGRLKHLDDVTNTVRRDVSTACLSRRQDNSRCAGSPRGLLCGRGGAAGRCTALAPARVDRGSCRTWCPLAPSLAVHRAVGETIGAFSWPPCCPQPRAERSAQPAVRSGGSQAPVPPPVRVLPRRA